MIDTQRLKTDLLALALLAGILFLALSLFSYDPADPPADLIYPANPVVTNLCGPAGAKLAHNLQSLLGMGSWIVLAALIVIDVRLFSRRPMPPLSGRLLGWGLICLAGCLAFQLVAPRFGRGPAVGSGGYVGAWGRHIMERQFSLVGSMVFVSTCVVAGMLLTGEWIAFRMLGTAAVAPLRLSLWLGKRLADRAREVSQADQLEQAAAPGCDLTFDEVEQSTHETEETEEFKVNPPVGMNAESDDSFDLAVLRQRPELPTDYELPGTDLLDESEEFPFELLAKKAQIAAATLEQTFQEFGLNVKVSEIDTGPVVTQFELDLEPGLRVSKVVNLQDDLAIALRVPAVRVVSPIPGKNTVGVEVPNDRRVMVRLKELLEGCQDQTESMRIPIYLGKDVSGRSMVVDLTKMPHLLIAGRTGTGKSVCLNSLITSILMTRSPDDVRMLMVDPKMVELSPYMNIPHLMHPVITDMKKAEAVLAWAVDKMEERYDLLAQVGVRHLDSYNRLGKEKVLKKMGIDRDSEEAQAIPERMPYIVIIADEMADLMMTSGKDVEAHIIRLAQKSRAVGIHLVLATQKPTVDVITGLIKSNLPARISFQVASRTDSRVVLDECGAERLLGNGDMLYLAPGTSNLTRAQGTFISDEELQNIIDFYAQYDPQYEDEIEVATKAALQADSPSSDSPRQQDSLYPQAVETVIREGRGSVSLLQRALGIGYGRAARMVDWMAEDGIVGDYNGSKCREVICTMEDWRARQSEPLELSAV